jgi:hypothetical protein
MLKKIIEIIVKRVLWPLLKTIVELVIIQAAQWILERIRQILRKWRQEEETAAATPEERDAIHKKYTRREADLAGVEREIPEKMREIVRGALDEADKQTALLIEDSARSPAAKPKKPRKKPAARKRKT